MDNPLSTRQRNKILHLISYDHKNRVDHFRELEIDSQIEILLQLSNHVKSQLLKELDDEHVIRIVNKLNPDDATDILQLLNKKRQEAILEQLSENLKDNVASLLKFDPETAAGLMNLDYIKIHQTETIENAAVLSRKHEKRTGKPPTILVVDKDNNLLGYLPPHELAFAKTSDTVSEFAKKIHIIRHDARYREVIAHFRGHPHSKVVVTGDDNQILGVIYTDDILKILSDDVSSSLYNFAGVSKEESIYDSASRKIKFRYKWLMLNLATAFLAAFVVGLFDETISRHVLLAVYMPIVAGMGGNAGTQTLAVMVRGLSASGLTLTTILHTLRSEITSGIVNGIINGVIVTGIVYLLNRDLLVGIVLGMAMIINLFIAGTFGTLVPVIMKKLGKDPASSATIFITTATDVFGFLAFLGLAALLLS